MSYAEVSVNSPAGERQLFSYSIPEGLSLRPGHAVWAPFGSRILQGIVGELSQYPSVESVRPIDSLIQPEPLLSPIKLELALWISRYYLSPLFAAIALFLPPGFERQPLTLLTATEKTGLDATNLSEDLQKTLKLIRSEGTLGLKPLEKELGKKVSAQIFQSDYESQWKLYNAITYLVSHVIQQRYRARYQMATARIFGL